MKITVLLMKELIVLIREASLIPILLGLFTILIHVYLKNGKLFLLRFGENVTPEIKATIMCQILTMFL